MDIGSVLSGACKSICRKTKATFFPYEYIFSTTVESSYSLM